MPYRLATVVAVLLSVPPAAAQRAPFPVQVQRVEAVGTEASFGSILSVAVGPDGSVYGVDHVNARVVAFGPDGRERWRSAGQGRGPGELQIPYRVAVAGDGTVYVFDMGAAEVSRFSPAGRFLGRARLPVPLSQVDGMLVLANGEVALSGYAPDAAETRPHAIHRYVWEGERLRHVGSFGPLPRVRDPEVLRSWGGSIRGGSGGTIWYARRSPYEVYRFGPDGSERAVLRPPFRSRGTPDDAVSIEREGRGTTYSAGDGEVVYPAGAVELGSGLLLVTRITAAGRWWDLFGNGGRLVASRRVPDAWGTPAAYDAARGVLWSSGTYEDEPVLLRLSIRLSPASTSSARGG